MKNIITVMKKELFRFFHDKRMVMTSLIMPGLMIYIMYTIMGQALSSMNKVDDNYKFAAYAVNMPADFENTFAQSGLSFDTNTLSQDDIKKKIADKETDIFIVFPENFLEKVSSYDISSGTAAPHVEIFYNSAKKESDNAYKITKNIFDNYENSMINKFDVNDDLSTAATDTQYDLASDKDVTGMIFSALFPMLILMMVFSSCMAIAPESIAGEKERGTLTTILVTPIKRGELALGKVFSLSILALLGGISSFIGIALSLPNLMKMEGSDTSVSANVYGVGDYAILLFVVLASVLLIISLLSVVSAYAKTVKEAGSYISPIYIIIILVGISSMFMKGDMTAPYWYAIPLFNSVLVMNSVFTFAVSIVNVIITVAANVIYGGIFAYILTRMFNSEKIMFGK